MGLLQVPIKLRQSAPRWWQILITCTICTAMLLSFSPLWNCFGEEGHSICGTVLFHRPYEGGSSMGLVVIKRKNREGLTIRGGGTGDGQVSGDHGVLPVHGQLSDVEQGGLGVGAENGSNDGVKAATWEGETVGEGGEGSHHGVLAGVEDNDDGPNLEPTDHGSGIQIVEGDDSSMGVGNAEAALEQKGEVQGTDGAEFLQGAKEERPLVHEEQLNNDPDGSSNAGSGGGVSEVAKGLDGLTVNGDQEESAKLELGSSHSKDITEEETALILTDGLQEQENGGVVSDVNATGGLSLGAGDIVRPHPSCRPDELVYVYDLPSQFHTALLTETCAGSHLWSQHPRNACTIYSPEFAGIGPPLLGAEKEYLEEIGSSVHSWADTGQFALEVMFHQYMLDSYPCRTARGDDAAAFYVPFYPGMLHHNRTLHCRDYECPEVAPLALAGRLLGAQLNKEPYWRRHRGRDHITTMSHVNVDGLMDDTCCTNGLLKTKHTKHFVIMGIESSSLTAKERQVSIPYPTCFHPATPTELAAHQELITSSNRSVLASFAGQLDRTGLFWGRNLRQSIAEQCRNHPGDCDLLECGMECPCTSVVRAQLRANFCLQPTGDSPTRRSLFDSLQAGCIPVLFHRASAYDEYTSFLPADESSYSVFIPESDVTNGGVDIIEILRSIPAEELERKRKVIASMLPSISYEDHGRAHAPAASGEFAEIKPVNPLGERSAYGVALAEALRRVASALSSRPG